MSKRFIIINGPNLNLLGKREPDVYGEKDFESFFKALRDSYPDIKIDYYQSNVEGELINKLHETGFSFDGIIINPGGYSHTSVALRDAISAIKSPVIEVHISNIHAREEFRQTSLTAAACVGVITGFGLWSYDMALQFLLDH
ncbi:MAG: type II 3-dehydroquinate dehydratase [Flavobacteriales bacterium]